MMNELKKVWREWRTLRATRHMAKALDLMPLFHPARPHLIRALQSVAVAYE